MTAPKGNTATVVMNMALDILERILSQLLCAKSSDRFGIITTVKGLTKVKGINMSGSTIPFKTPKAHGRLWKDRI